MADLLLLLVLRGLLVAASNSTDNWTSITQTNIFQNLPSCAQACVRDVNQNIFVGNIHCQSYGCVCAESTQGQNFLDGLSNVTECAKSSCSDTADVTSAEVAFQDLCVVYAANYSRPAITPGKPILRITSDDYKNLTNCAKFALNGCLDEDGNRTESNCGPASKPARWEEYRGVAYARQCKTPECLCKSPKFDASFAVAYDAGETYCGMWVSVEALRNQEYEDMQNVFATFCASVGFPPKNWTLRVTGYAPGSNTTSVESKSRSGGLTKDQKIQIGYGTSFGVLGLAISIATLVFTIKMLNITEKAAGLR